MNMWATNRVGVRRVWVRLFGMLFTALALMPAFVLAQSAPTLSSPGPAATNVSTRPVLSWVAASGDSVYHLQIDTSLTFTTAIVNDSTVITASKNVLGLRNATVYHWRVRVKKNAVAGGGTSPFSATRSFTTWTVTPTTAHLPVTLGLTGGFAILSYAGITNTGPSSIVGDVGVSPLAASYMTGFDTSNVSGTIYGVDATGPVGSIPFPTMLTQAMGDLTTAFNDAAGRTVDPIGIAGNIGGQTLYPGLYKSNAALEITSGNLTLDGQGDINAVWIFQIGSNFNMTPGRQVFLSGGAKASNVFWQVGSAATFGTTTVMKGTIMAHATITFSTGASLEGRALSRTEAVTLQSNSIGGSAGTPVRPVTFLGSAANFKVLAGSKISNTGPSVVVGDVGVSPSTVITGFPPGTITGVRHPGNATSAAAQLDARAAFDSASTRPADASLSPALGGNAQTLIPGVYASTGGGFTISDTLTLDGGGDASAVWVFKMTGTLNAMAASTIKLIDGARWQNVFWQVGSSAVLGTNSVFRGTIMASTSIKANNGARIVGRLLALADSVHLDNASVGDTLGAVTTVGDEVSPAAFTLLQNYPNPFNPSTTIEYRLETSGPVSLRIFDVLGQEVAILVNGAQAAGSYAVPFTSVLGSHTFSSGVYFYRLQAGASSTIRKMILMK